MNVMKEKKKKLMKKRLQDSKLIKILKLSFRDSKINISNIFKKIVTLDKNINKWKFLLEGKLR